MELRRKFYSLLLDWKDHHRQECLLIKGARQIGKTFLVEKLGREAYGSTVSLPVAAFETAYDGLLWTNGAPGQIAGAAAPLMRVYVPDKRPAGSAAVIICPGGGYGGRKAEFRFPEARLGAGSDAEGRHRDRVVGRQADGEQTARYGVTIAHEDKRILH